MEVDEKVILSLQQTINNLQSQVEALQDFVAQHAGFDYGFTGVGFSHPNQKVNMIEYAQGNQRITKTGIQIKQTAFNVGFAGFSFVDQFTESINTYKPIGKIVGYANPTNGQVYVSTVSNGSLAASSATEDIYVNEGTPGSEIARTDFTMVPGGLGSQQVFFRIESIVNGNKRVSISGGASSIPVLGLNSDTVDPPFALNEGDIWSRLDLKRIRARLNGVNESLAPESWVTANFAPIAPTYAHELMLMGA